MGRVKARVWLTMLVLLSACATSRQGGPSVAVTVRNNLIPPTPVRVYMVSQTGQESYLGAIVAGSTRTLRYEGQPPVGEHRLLARSEAGSRRILSDILPMDGVAALEWTLKKNLVEIRDTTRGD